MIKLGRTGYWFNGRGFLVGDREKNRPITDEDRRPLLAYLCACADRLPRWQGEENDLAELFTIGMHSRLVAALAGRLALVRGLDATAVRVAVRLGAGITTEVDFIKWASTSHEPLTDLRDAVDEWCSWIDEVCELATGHVIKDADHLAAALERRYHFVDLSRDLEHPDVDALIVEAGLHLDAMFPLVEHAGELVDLIMGTDTHDVLVCGEPVIEHGEVCRPRPTKVAHG